MTDKAIKELNSSLRNLGINIEFGGYTGPLDYPIFDTFYQEFEPMSEDGYEEGTFILTGTTNTNYSDLEKIKNKVKEKFPILGYNHMFPDGSAMVVMYQDAHQIPSTDGSIKRIQIDLKVKEWTV